MSTTATPPFLAQEKEQAPHPQQHTICRGFYGYYLDRSSGLIAGVYIPFPSNPPRFTHSHTHSLTHSLSLSLTLPPPPFSLKPTSHSSPHRDGKQTPSPHIRIYQQPFSLTHLRILPRTDKHLLKDSKNPLSHLPHSPRHHQLSLKRAIHTAAAARYERLPARLCYSILEGKIIPWEKRATLNASREYSVGAGRSTDSKRRQGREARKARQEVKAEGKEGLPKLRRRSPCPA